MKTIKSIARVAFFSGSLLMGLNACNKDKDVSNTGSSIVQEQEDLTSANAMEDALKQMGIYNDSLTSNGHHHDHWNHNDSIYHHHDSLFWHHHTIYHHGDTAHHHGHHTQWHHHVHDSIHNSHNPHHH